MEKREYKKTKAGKWLIQEDIEIIQREAASLWNKIGTVIVENQIVRKYFPLKKKW
jgi:hypothetical protein